MTTIDLSRPDGRVKAGCDVSLTFALGVDLTGCTVSWVAGRDPSWRDPGITVSGLPSFGYPVLPSDPIGVPWVQPIVRKSSVGGGITITTLATGEGSVTLSAADTAVFASERGMLLGWDLVVRAADGTLSCPLSGRLFVTPAVGWVAA